MIGNQSVACRHSLTMLQTWRASQELQKRFLCLWDDARTRGKEQGVNVLYLALGMLKWVDPQSGANVRRKPLIVMPVRLECGAAGERFRLCARSENLSVDAILHQTHMLKLPLNPGDEFDSTGYLDVIAAAVKAEVLQTP